MSIWVFFGSYLEAVVFHREKGLYVALGFVLKVGFGKMGWEMGLVHRRPPPPTPRSPPPLIQDSLCLFLSDRAIK